jgi:hypothetical protein
MAQSPSSGPNDKSTGQKSILMQPKDSLPFRKRPPLDLILNRIILFLAPTPYSFKVHLAIVLLFSSHLRPNIPSCFFYSDFVTKILYEFFLSRVL